MKLFRYKKTILGFSLLFVLLIVSLLYPLYGPKDFNSVFFLYDNKGELVGVPPIPPSSYYPLGSDRNGADMLYMILYGAKFTLLIAFGVTILRVLIGGFLGVLFSLWFKKLLPIAKDFLLVFNLVPPIIITLVLMSRVTMYIEDAIFSIMFYQMIVLVIIGIPSVLLMTSDIIEEIKGKSFIMCSYLMGGDHLHVLKTQLKPFLKSYGLLMFFQQLLNTFILIMYLGAFQIYIGGASKFGIRGLDIPYSNSKEWAGLIGQNIYEFFRAPYLVLFPLICYFVIILIINMIKKELEANMDLNSLEFNFKKRKFKKELTSGEVTPSTKTTANFTFHRNIS